jgi:hypothetical protein
MDNISDNRLIIFYGMMKAGNHAIIKWIFENALRMDLKESVIQRQKIRYNENSKVGNLLAFYNDVTRNPPPPRYITPCKITIISLEEEYEELENIPLFKDMKWKSVHKVFIFRDLKNMIASRKKSREYSERFFGTTESMCKLWKTLHEKYEYTKNLEPKTTHLALYDKIVSNGDSDLIELLELKRTFRFNQIPRIMSNNHKPGWSSFTDDKFTERHKQLNKEDNDFIDKFLTEKNL